MRERPSDEDIHLAILEQEGMCRNALSRRGAFSATAFDDLMGEVTEAVVASIPRWQDHGYTSFKAWATGVADKTIKRRAKAMAQRNQREVLKDPLEGAVASPNEASIFEDLAGVGELMDAALVGEESAWGLVADVVAAPPAPPGEDDDFYVQMLRKAKARIASQPGGAGKWARLQAAIEQPVRGRSAREQLRREMAAVSGYAVEFFGALTEDQTADDEPAEEPSEGSSRVVVELVAVAGDAFRAECSVCGHVDGLEGSVAVVMDVVRRHRAWHLNEGADQ